ncbi:MAG: 30S ribosomal protein S6 [Coriobacteriales bacterium]|jgi:small subunit ribosomal protein S6|nr:30S ribosomal protein S6 [Coriobacteriales bacterium]
MNAYELMYFVNSALSEEDQAEIGQKVADTLTGQNATIEKTEAMGKRKLAYPINDLVDGTYTLVEFQAEPTVIAELERVFRISDAIERFVIVRRKAE